MSLVVACSRVVGTLSCVNATRTAFGEKPSGLRRQSQAGPSEPGNKIFDTTMSESAFVVDAIACRTRVACGIVLTGMRCDREAIVRE